MHVWSEEAGEVRREVGSEGLGRRLQFLWTTLRPSEAIQSVP